MPGGFSKLGYISLLEISSSDIRYEISPCVLIFYFVTTVIDKDIIVACIRLQFARTGKYIYI